MSGDDGNCSAPASGFIGPSHGTVGHAIVRGATQLEQHVNLQRRCAKFDVAALLAQISGSSVCASSIAPNVSRAAITLTRFARDARTKVSKSALYLGAPWNVATASLPTMT